ncbi:unnamed protein product, partial [Thlaspi arvense]
FRYVLTRNGDKITDDEVKNAIRGGDVDGDGRLNYDEFVKLLYAVTRNGAKVTEDDVKKAIKAIDMDAELQRVLKINGEEKTDEDAYKEACRLIKEYDVDGDGRLNFDEFVKVMVAIMFHK